MIKISIVFLSLFTSVVFAQQENLKCKKNMSEIKKEAQKLTCGPTVLTLDQQMDDLIKISNSQASTEKYISQMAALSTDIDFNENELQKRKELIDQYTFLYGIHKRQYEVFEELKTINDTTMAPLEAYFAKTIPYLEKNSALVGTSEYQKTYAEYTSKVTEYENAKSVIVKKMSQDDISGNIILSMLDFSASKEDLVAKIANYKNNLELGQKEVLRLEEKMKKIKDPVAKDQIVKEEVQILDTQLKAVVSHLKSNAKFQDCGLTDPELHAIYLYSGNTYGVINQALRTKDSQAIARYQFFIDSINSGLSKLQNYEGYVKRSISVNSTVLATFCEGCIVKEEAFTSTSKKGGFPGNQRFLIKSKTGNYIAPLSNSAHEEEVLFKSGTRFKVLAVEKDVYVLEEVDEKAEP